MKSLIAETDVAAILALASASWEQIDKQNRDFVSNLMSPLLLTQITTFDSFHAYMKLVQKLGVSVSESQIVGKLTALLISNKQASDFTKGSVIKTIDHLFMLPAGFESGAKVNSNHMAKEIDQFSIMDLFYLEPSNRVATKLLKSSNLNRYPNRSILFLTEKTIDL
jgi:hypothetical protein